jgi:hypothetical protein
MPGQVTTEERRRPSPAVVVLCASLVAVLTAPAAAFVAWRSSSTTPRLMHRLSAARPATTTTTTISANSNVPGISTTAPAPGPTRSTSLPPLPSPAGPGFVPGRATAVGDSVMLDYQDPLEAAIPGINVNALVSRQWSDGEVVLYSLKAEGHLGAYVIVALGTNGPIADTDFDHMMAILGGASRVVFVNVHVDRPWQDTNNAVLARGAARYHNVVVADWAVVAAQNPQWFGADGTHLAIDGPGADALAALVTTTLVNG